MPATKTLNLRVDSTLKSQADAIFSELGLPTSTAISLIYMQNTRMMKPYSLSMVN